MEYNVLDNVETLYFKTQRKVNMVTRKNTKNQTAYAGNVTPSGLGIFYSVPLPGSKVAQRLTLRSGRNTIEMSGNQVRSLTRVLRAAKRVAR